MVGYPLDGTEQVAALRIATGNATSAATPNVQLDSFMVLFFYVVDWRRRTAMGWKGTSDEIEDQRGVRTGACDKVARNAESQKVLGFFGNSRSEFQRRRKQVAPAGERHENHAGDQEQSRMNARPPAEPSYAPGSDRRKGDEHQTSRGEPSENVGRVQPRVQTIADQGDIFVRHA